MPTKTKTSTKTKISTKTKTKTKISSKVQREREMEKKRLLKEKELEKLRFKQEKDRMKLILKMQREVEKERIKFEKARARNLLIYNRLLNQVHKAYDKYNLVLREYNLALSSGHSVRASLKSRLILSHSKAILAYNQFVSRFPEGCASGGSIEEAGAGFHS